MVDRAKLISLLLKSGIQEIIITVLQNMYSNVKVSVRRHKCHTKDFFTSQIGVKQGCMLSPILFPVYINELTSTVVRKDTHGIFIDKTIEEIFLL